MIKHIKEAGRISRIIKDGRSLYPYKHTGGGKWTRCKPTPDAAREGLKQGIIKFK